MLIKLKCNWIRYYPTLKRISKSDAIIRINQKELKSFTKHISWCAKCFIRVLENQPSLPANLLQKCPTGFVSMRNGQFLGKNDRTWSFEFSVESGKGIPSWFRIRETANIECQSPQ